MSLLLFFGGQAAATTDVIDLGLTLPPIRGSGRNQSNPFAEALDNALAMVGEDIVIRRVVSAGVNVDVKCRARIDGENTQEIAAGIAQTDLHVIISPSEINAAQWPGGTVPLLPPFDLDQRVPRINDKVIVQRRLRSISFVEPMFVGGDLVRINMRVSG